MKRVAVILFNLGGPDRPEDVQPFLFNLFNDPAIIRLPAFLRWLLARIISKRRAPIAREIYANIGGGSPLLANTKAQAEALQATLSEAGDLGEVKCFISMRYWNPRALETAEQVKRFDPERIVLLPLYPQFSTSTSESSLKDWTEAARKVGINARTHAVCCYPRDSGFVVANANLIRDTLKDVEDLRKACILFSAHGLPKKIVTAGDPYQWQVEQSVAQVVEQLKDLQIDWSVCYQSRVGPLEWIGPATEDEIKRAGGEGREVVLVPIAFVSEHSETLVELDIEYRELAESCGVVRYHRVPTVSVQPDFIAGLAKIVRGALESKQAVCTQEGHRICPAKWTNCALAGQGV